MKDLNKYIRESILGNEDDLVVDIKKSTNDLFTRMIAAVESKMSSYDFYKSLERGNCIEWIYENFPSLKQFKLHFDLNYKNGAQDNKHGFDRTHNLVRIGISMYKKSPSGDFLCFDIMTFEYSKLTNNVNIVGKAPANVSIFTYWDVKNYSNFYSDLNKFMKKYDLIQIKLPSPYLKRYNMQWGCYKQIK